MIISLSHLDLPGEEMIQCEIITYSDPAAERVSDHLPVVAEFKSDLQFRDQF